MTSVSQKKVDRAIAVTLTTEVAFTRLADTMRQRGPARRLQLPSRLFYHRRPIYQVSDGKCAATSQNGLELFHYLDIGRQPGNGI